MQPSSMRRSGFTLGVWLAVAACTGPAGPAGADSVVRTHELAPGPECGSGGVVVDNGLDRDHDGQLGDDEVQGTTTICHGPPSPETCGVTENADGSATLRCTDGTSATVQGGIDGPPALVRMAEEPPGAECPAGGTVIYAGTDRDGDGELDVEEIATSSVVCDGESLGGIARVRLDPEAPGDNCALGGTAVRSGLDEDDSGVLDDAEILQTAYVCNGDAFAIEGGVVEGDYQILNTVDVALLAGVTEITGDLLGAPDTMTEMVLPSLRTVGGDLRAYDNVVVRVLLPQLSTVGGDLYLGGPATTECDISSLSAVGGCTSIPDVCIAPDGFEPLEC